MPKRSEGDESEWTIRKSDILDLYVEQDRPLSEVIRVMANQGFIRTKPQYERSLKRWRVCKNVRKEEWDFILSRMNQRQRPTTVKVRGITIPQSRLERQKLRHRESTLDHYKSKLNPSPCCQTPPNIEVSTPPPMSKVDALQLVVSSEQNHNRKDTEEHDEELSSGDNVQVQNVQLSEEVSTYSPVYEDSNPRTLSETTGNDSANGTSRTRETSPSLSCLLLTNGHPIFSAPLYGSTYDSVSDNSGSVFEEIARLKSQRQAHEYQQTAEDVLNHSVDILVKTIVRHKTLSRRFRGIVRRSRDDFDLELLRRVLIATKLDGDWKIFGETLLFDAVKDGNRPLIDVLLNAGVDNMASDGILSPSELAELLLATSPPLGSFENPIA
ncbi:hypothetical protein B0T12DRAFT_100025 [Alternaria alternata]|nr:hypothetical protein B0T12DRAFT_100025 [Alternaria alternata]